MWSHEGVFQHNQFLGEICLALDTYDFETASQEEKYYKLCDYSSLEMIPNPNLARRQSTKYRVRTKVPEGATGVPTLYDSSTDLRATEAEGELAKEAASASAGEGRDESDRESILTGSEKALTVPDRAVTSTPEQLSSQSSPSGTPSKTPAEKKTPKARTLPHDHASKPHKPKYHTVSASTRPSAAARGGKASPGSHSHAEPKQNKTLGSKPRQESGKDELNTKENLI